MIGAGCFPGKLEARSFRCLITEIPCVSDEGRDVFTDVLLVLYQSPKQRILGRSVRRSVSKRRPSLCLHPFFNIPNFCIVGRAEAGVSPQRTRRGAEESEEILKSLSNGRQIGVAADCKPVAFEHVGSTPTRCTILTVVNLLPWEAFGGSSPSPRISKIFLQECSSTG